MEWKHWPSLPLTKRDRLPTQSGIYVVVDADDQVWYVGLSTNLHARWNGRGHHRYRQLSRTNSKRSYRIHWRGFPPEQLAEQELLYIEQFKPHLNYSRVRTYARSAVQPHQELSRLFKVINRRTTLFPDIRSVVLGYYTDLDEDEAGDLKEYTCIVMVVNVNDHDRVILKSINKSLSTKGLNLKDSWFTFETDRDSSHPNIKSALIPVFILKGLVYEFICDYSLLDRLGQNKDSLYTVELAGQSVLALKELGVLPSLLAIRQPRNGREIYLHDRASELRPIGELLEGIG